ncbi:hypothetical protein DYB32_002579 [Aphanomyces invadans]|uniref:Uncharacterized protein n=1 Tax=Aphanomyces invadans TaxID=157072 RepID=A0A3R6W0V1_9STRA|nr:hypothetical protein DYB32_002579 [Aphanomyces invadans]
MSPQTKPTSTAPLPSVDPAAAQKALDKKMKQRLYIRKMMRIYRDEHRQCREYLIKRIDELSVQLAELVRRSSVRKESSTMLSWRDVSHAIHEDLQACAGDNQGLESQVGAYRNLLGNMQRWVASSITPHTNEFMSFLGGEFHDGPDKVMFVIQQIVDDETQTKHHHHHRQRNRKFWFVQPDLSSSLEQAHHDGRVEMRPQPVGGGTYIRYIAICTQSLAQGRYFTLEEEASVFGLDLSTCPDVDKESRLTTHMTRIIWQKRWNCQKRAGDLLSQSIVAT